jgi:hypothetical protein
MLQSFGLAEAISRRRTTRITVSSRPIVNRKRLGYTAMDELPPR